MNSGEFSEKKYSDSKWAGYSVPEIVRMEKVLQLVGCNKRVLDVGSYEGKYSIAIKKQNNEVYACDASEAFEKTYIDSGINFQKVNLEKTLPYEDAFFDCVFAGEVIEHIADTDLFIKDINRILKPEGYLVLTTPNIGSLARRILLLLGKNPFFEASFTFPEGAAGHLRYFTPPLLTSYLKSNNFEIIEHTSDVVSFSNKISFSFLAKILPGLGRSIVLKCQKRS